MTRTITVELGDRSYPIHVGEALLANAGKEISRLRPNARCAIISDDNVYKLHGKALEESLSGAGLEFANIVVPPGEKSKSISELERVVSGLLDAKLERGDLVIAFGGGVVGDLAGFAAAITRRGMEFVQIPTSLLAQVDSSVGGKTGINASQGKNLIGAFHQPIMVIADTDLLKTLPSREFAAGYAEVAKYGLINQPNFFSWLGKNRSNIFAFEDELAEAIALSCQSKADIVALDEHEHGARALLNLGHTFGHALEGVTKYDSERLVHGEGVSIGMVLAHRFSNRLNLCSVDDMHAIEEHLKACGLPTKISEISGPTPTPDELMQYINQDKKVSRGKLTFILSNGIGNAHIANDVSGDEVLTFLNEEVTR